mgnify:CR=1 FL=1
MGNRTMRNRISIYRKLTRLGAWLASGLLVGQCVLVLVSWLQTAAMPETFPRTLLNAEGIRWFFGRFTENLMQPMLVWLLLLCISLAVTPAFKMKFWNLGAEGQVLMGACATSIGAVCFISTAGNIASG